MVAQGVNVVSRRSVVVGLGAAFAGPTLAPQYALAQSAKPKLAASPAKPNRAAKRVALLIGIDTYDAPEIMPNLKTPLNDVKAVGDKLKSMGIEVIPPLINSNAAALREGIRALLDRLAEIEVAMIYYAGHGIQATRDGSTPVRIFAPADFRDPTFGAPDRTAAFEKALYEGTLVTLNHITDKILNLGKVGIVFWDACRENPFYVKPVALQATQSGRVAAQAGQTTRSLGDGSKAEQERGGIPFGREEVKDQNVTGLSGLVVHNASQPGRVAYDGAIHSPYAKALLKHIDKRGAGLTSMLLAVTTEVARNSQGKQIPQIENNLIGGDLVLWPAPPTRRPNPPAPTESKTPSVPP